MVADNRYKQFRMKGILPVLSLAIGLVAAGLIAAAPAALLDGVIERSRLAMFVPLAAPPIGVTGRTLLALAGGGAIALLGLMPRLVSSLFVGRSRRATRLGATPLLRRADAHPDAPARAPIAARSELGDPLPIIGEGAVPDGPEQSLPDDLDLPLAAFDPDALAGVPIATGAAERGERFETFPLPGAREVADQPAASISALLDRLERGATRRAATRDQAQGVEDTLGALRKLAAN
ncbi:hypothetical protein [uncultured Sphingomonas sp.]|uniref:hypothetical protein n=1 Tax=uncultured Sphingomonas sp. TaxID=158754 RepID=UPI00262A013F|nr:hypothetical protein [uncultured Sphingomonas sp.]